MTDIQIKAESLPQRCEICHQSDQFDVAQNHCYRCAGMLPQIQQQANTATAKPSRLCPQCNRGYVTDTSATICSTCAWAKQKYQRVGGWLAFFCFGLTVIAPLSTLFNLYIGIVEARKYSDQFPGLMAMAIVDGLLGGLVILFSIYAGIRLIQIKPNAVKTAKLYLMILLIYSLLEIPLVFLAGLPSQANGQLISEGAINFLRTACYVSIWFSYLNRSERVRLTYQTAPEEFIEGVKLN